MDSGRPPIALTVRSDAGQFVFLLSDGRMAPRFVRARLDLPTLQAQSAAALHGSVAARLALWQALFPGEIGPSLAQTTPRALELLLPRQLDGLAWELAGAGGAAIGPQWAISRHLLNDGDDPPAEHAAPPRPGPLRCVVAAVDADASAAWRLGFDAALAVTRFAPMDPRAPHLVTTAWGEVDLAVLDATAATALARIAAALARAPRLSLLSGASDEARQTLAEHLPRLGGALWCVPRVGTLLLHSLQQLLGQGAAVAEAVRQLHADPNTSEALRGACLYGPARQPLLQAAAPADLSASLRQVTTLSLDLVDSTAALHRLGDERYSELLTAFHRTCAQVIARHGGRADDPQGDDGIMCYFGYPEASETAAESAVNAGLQLLQAVQRLQVRVRIGIATGRVAVRDAQPVGLSIHMAARLQSVAAPGSVLVSESTHALVAQRFQMEALPQPLALKGIDGLARAYRVLQPLDRHDGSAMLPIHRLTPFVGRDTELDALAQQWQRALQGQLRATLVVGEAGIGKSRLVTQFCRQLGADGQQVLYVRAHADLRGSAFGALDAMLRQVFQLHADDDHTTQQRKIKRALPAGLALDEAVPLLGALLSIQDSGPALPASLGARQRERTLGLLCDWFRLEVQHRPTCLVIEDAHWLDPSTRELLNRLLAEPEGLAMMLLATQRHPVDNAWAVPATHQTLRLQGLTPGASRRLARHACGERPLSQEVLRMLAVRSDGVPLFLEESVEMALESGLGEAGAPQALRLEVPVTLQDLLMARLDRMGEARAVAQVGAALGRQFPQPLLHAVLLHSGDAARAERMGEHLLRLQRSGLLRRLSEAGETAWSFKHALVRDTAYQSLWERDRQKLHRDVSTVLAQQFAALVERQPELLARHQTLAGLDEQALAQWEKAARRAAAASAHEEAIGHLDNALQLLPALQAGAQRDAIELRLHLLLASRCIATEGYGARRVERLYTRAAELCRQLSDDAALLKVELGLQGWCFMRGDLMQALDIAHRCRQVTAASKDPMQRLQADWALAVTLFHRGDAVAAVALMDHIGQHYRPDMHRPAAVQDPGVMSLCYSAWAQWELGHVDDALRRAQQVIQLAQGLKHRFSLAEAHGFAASVHLFRGEIEAGLGHASRAIEICDNEGFAVWLAHAMVMRGSLRCAQGQLDEGLADMAEGVSMWVGTGAVVTLPMYLSLYAQGLASAGRIDDALAQLQRAQTLIDTHGEHYHEAEVRRLRGELLLQRAARLNDGAHDAQTAQTAQRAAGEAEACLQSAVDLAEAQHKASFVLRATVALARCWLARGEAARAAAHLDAALAALRGADGSADAKSAELLMREARRRANMQAPDTP